MKIVAEIGTGHNGDIVKAKELISASAESGADCVKFQIVYADEILHPETGFVQLPTGNIPLYERFKQLEVKSEFYAELCEYAKKLNVEWTASPFGLKSLQELYDLNPAFIKVASPELNHFPMLKKIAAMKKNVPVVLSSGVSKLSDIEKALEIIEPSVFDVTLLHCITSYPAPETEYNLKLVKTLSDIFGIKTGVSDHSLDPVLVPVLSTIMGGTMIEKHITLSRKTSGLDDPVALEPDQFACMVHSVHQTQVLIEHYKKITDSKKQIPDEAVNDTLHQLYEQYGTEKVDAALGNGIKTLARSELMNYGRTNRSIHFMRNMKKGEKISIDDVKVLRTEKVLSPGISPEYIDLVCGAVLSRDVSSGQGLLFEDLILVS